MKQYPILIASLWILSVPLFQPALLAEQTMTPSVGTTATSMEMNPSQGDKLIGTWTARYAKTDGTLLTEYTSFRADGTMTIHIVDAMGQLVRHAEGTYVRKGDEELSFATEGQQYEVSLSWIHDQELVLHQGTQAITYLRLEPDPPSPQRNPARSLQEETQPEYAKLTCDMHRVGSGTILVYHQQGIGSAKQMLRLALNDLAERLGSRPRLLNQGAIGDRQDHSVQVWFQATVGNTLLQGLAFVAIEESNGQAVLLYDAKDNSLEPLFAACQRVSAKDPSPVVWLSVPLPDDSGTLRLPQGWHIVNADKGMVEAQGEQGAVSFGLALPVVTPQAVQQFLEQSHLPATMINVTVAPYTDPETALRHLFPQFSNLVEQTGGAPMQLLRVLDKIPLQGTLNGQAAYLYYEWESGYPGKTQRYQTLAMVNVAPISSDQWLFYASSVSAPAETFLRDLPLLIDIWKSWKVADWVQSERLMKAMKSHRETFDLQQSAYGYRSHTFDRSMKAWSEYQRGEHAVLDNDHGEVRPTDARRVDQIVQELNALEGYERYIKVNPFQLDY